MLAGSRQKSAEHLAKKFENVVCCMLFSLWEKTKTGSAGNEGQAMLQNCAAVQHVECQKACAT